MTSHNKSFPVFVALLISLSWLSARACLAEPQINVGVSLPLTGGAANEGEDLKRILEFANKTLTGGRYRLIFEDDKCSNKEAVTTAQKFSSIDKVQFSGIFGSFGFDTNGDVKGEALTFILKEIRNGSSAAILDETATGK